LRERVDLDLFSRGTPSFSIIGSILDLCGSRSLRRRGNRVAVLVHADDAPGRPNERCDQSDTSPAPQPTSSTRMPLVMPALRRTCSVRSP
jgi:hypothetical protein